MAIVKSMNCQLWNCIVKLYKLINSYGGTKRMFSVLCLFGRSMVFCKTFGAFSMASMLHLAFYDFLLFYYFYFNFLCRRLVLKHTAEKCSM